MKIYYQYSTRKTVTPKKGDFITEINCMRVLSKFADVYYSGTLFKPDEKRYGLREYSGSIIKRMKRKDYDAYFVRSNRELFEAIGKNKVKFWNAGTYPKEKDIFKKATAIYTRTDIMKRVFTEGIKVWANPNGVKLKNVFVFPQPYGDMFRSCHGEEKTEAIRRSTGGEFIIGCFGTLRKSNFPHLLLKSLKYINRRYPRVKVLLGIPKDKNNSPRKVKNVICTKFPYKQVPYAISACDLCIVNETGITWNYLDGLKALEPAACGVPIVMPYADSRSEIMGSDYPLFLPMKFFRTPITKDKVIKFSEIVFRLIEDKEWYKEVSDAMPSRVSSCSIDAVSERVKKSVLEYIDV